MGGVVPASAPELHLILSGPRAGKWLQDEAGSMTEPESLSVFPFCMN